MDILLFVFDSSWFRSLGEWADCFIVINSRVGGGGRDTIARAGAGARAATLL